MSNRSSFSIGCDPELLLMRQESRELVSAIGIFPESKGFGRPLEKGAVLHDNVLVEFNTQPAMSEEQFIDIIGSVLRQIQELVLKEGLSLRLQAAAKFTESQLQHPEALQFGCDPDWDCWSCMMNQSPSIENVGAIRSAGGHIHLGYGENEELKKILSSDDGKIESARMMDLFCGLPATSLDNDSTSPIRRQLYGGAGAHRPKEYGIK